MATWFVDGLHGNDANAGTSLAQAFATLAKAAASMAAGDTVNVCATTTYNLTASVAWPTGASRVTISGANVSGVVDGTTATIATATDAVSPFATSAAPPGGYGLNLTNLICTSTATSPGPVIAITAGGFCSITASHCSFRGFSTLATNTGSSDDKSLYDCEISGSTGIGLNVGSNQTTLDSCAIHDNTGGGVAIFSSAAASFRDCEIYGNGGHGLNFTGDYGALNTLTGCTLANNAGDGYHDANATQSRLLFVVNNVFYGNSGYGFNTGATPTVLLNATNAYGGNTSGARSNLAASLTDITLTANPFVSASNLTPNTTAGGGALLRAAAYPGTFLDGTGSYRDVGAVQHQDAGSAPTPNTPTLTVIDKGDGTGATATIAGGDAGASNAVYVAPVPGSGNAAFALAATIAGNTSGNLSLDPGAYLAYAESTDNSLYALPSNTVFFRTTAPGGPTSIRAALFSYLSTNAGITALVGSNPARISPVKLPQGVARPAIVYRRMPAKGSQSPEDEGHAHDLLGSAGYAAALFKIDCLADTYGAADQLAEAVRDALDGLNQVTYAGVKVLSAIIDDELDDFDEPIDGGDSGVYVVSTLYRIVYDEAVPSLP